MTSKMHPDFKRGMTESRAAIADLQRRWPAAFPLADRDVRPLAGVIVAAIAAELGWSVPYCKGVLHIWKQRKTYCDAVLTYDLRRDLDGLPTEALVDADARRMAQTQLAALAAGRQKREARKAAEAAKVAAACVDATQVPSPTPERRRPILKLARAEVAQLA
jgi:sRNA-binding protein